MFLFVFVIAMAAAAAVVLFKDAKGGKKAALQIIPDNIDLQIKNFHYTEVGDPEWKWQINADTAKYAKKQNLAYFDRVKIKLIRRDGETLNISGDKGIYRTDNKNAQIIGNVELVTNRGERVTTEHLDYNDAEKKVSTADPVVFTSRNLEVKGKGMTFIVAEQEVTLHANVKAVFTK